MGNHYRKAAVARCPNRQADQQNAGNDGQGARAGDANVARAHAAEELHDSVDGVQQGRGDGRRARWPVEGQRSRVAKVIRAEGSARPISGTTSRLTGKPSAVTRWK